MSAEKPKILKKEKDIKAFKKIAAKFVDAFDTQVGELFFIENTQYIGEDKKKVFKSKEFQNYKKQKEQEVVFVFLPWQNTLIATLPARDYLELKTNRNRNLITKKEQGILRNKKIGVFGMSVGSNIAFVLTQAGISNEITIADFDTLETTNLNRILGGIHQIGLPKIAVASRRIYEDNPFAKVNVMAGGVNIKNLEKLLKEKKLDLIIEEIDEIKMKIETRILAMKYKIPVVMITDNGDGVILHIERYDLGHNKILDKDLSYWRKILKQKMTREIAGGVIMNDIAGGVKNIDPKMLESVKLVLEKKLVSWSQLGSAAILGGVVATVAVKNILLNKDKTKNVIKHIFV